MKREDLKKIEGITDAQVDAIMDLHQADVTGWNTQLEQQKSIVKDRDKTVEELTDKVKKFDGVDVTKLQEDLKNWETKYNEGLAAKDKEYATKMLFNNYKFSSKYAKKAVMEEFKSKNLEFKDGKFTGADEFFKDLKEKDPDTFKADEDDDPEGNGSTGLEHKGGSGGDEDGVTKYFKELNPDIKI